MGCGPPCRRTPDGNGNRRGTDIDIDTDTDSKQSGGGVVIRRRIANKGDGTFRINLPEHERDLLRGLAPDLRSTLIMEEDDSTYRLFPTVHADDAEAESKHQDMLHDQLLESRLAALDVLEEQADAESLSEDELTSWMQAINSIRLVMGTRLGISEETDETADIDFSQPDAFERQAYSYLGWLLEQVVLALHSALPEPNDAGDGGMR